MRKQFVSEARNAEIYANELAGRIKRNPKGHSDYVREMHDEHLAKWFVYDSVSFSSCLESRETFLAELSSRLGSPSESRAVGAFDRNDFEKHLQQHIARLIKKYGVV